MYCDIVVLLLLFICVWLTVGVLLIVICLANCLVKGYCCFGVFVYLVFIAWWCCFVRLIVFVGCLIVYVDLLIVGL